jgi:hypothetical protein
VGFVLLASLIGLPLGAVVLLALGFLYTLGYVASAYFLGRLIVKPPRGRVLPYVIGWAILSVVGLIPIVNVIVLIAATLFGVGMIVVATFRARWVSPEPAPTDAGDPRHPLPRDSRRPPSGVAGSHHAPCASSKVAGTTHLGAVRARLVPRICRRPVRVFGARCRSTDRQIWAGALKRSRMSEGACTSEIPRPATCPARAGSPRPSRRSQ